MTRHFLPLLAFGLLAGLAHAEPLIWAGYFFAEGRPEGPQAPPMLTQRLQRVFGFPCYKFVKGVNIDLRTPYPHWVQSRRDFVVKIQGIAHAPDQPGSLVYEIYKDGFIVARGQYLVARDTPLFINGPDLHRGRLIFVVEAR